MKKAVFSLSLMFLFVYPSILPAQVGCEDLGYRVIKENFVVEIDLPDTLWEWSVYYCGRMENLNDTEALRVVPVIHVQDIETGRFKTFEGVIGAGHLTNNFCAVDSVWDVVPPGKSFFFTVGSEKIRAANVNNLKSWIEFVVE